MRGSKFPADMHNYIWCPIYIPSFMIIGSVVSEELRWQDFGADGRTDTRTDGVTALLDLLSPSATQVKIGWVVMFKLKFMDYVRPMTTGVNGLLKRYRIWCWKSNESIWKYCIRVIVSTTSFNLFIIATAI